MIDENTYNEETSEVETTEPETENIDETETVTESTSNKKIVVNLDKVDSSSNLASYAVIVRTVVLVIVLVNQILCSTGIMSLRLNNDAVYDAVSSIATVIISGICWWKNNSFTKAAITADKVMRCMKDSEDGLDMDFIESVSNESDDDEEAQG
jgi:SPP1 family holin